ncbi:MAG TPA: cbb3-type cytochrome c oxidase subunit 3 [Longimicrobiales bacterium]|nr:cbb3-type cytochrome c oxidase subunit 3 [Longimicrobiales bacterium]
MNPLLREAAASVELAWVLSTMTVVFFAIFVGWIWYAWSPRNRRLMEEAAHMPLNDGGEA